MEKYNCKIQLKKHSSAWGDNEAGVTKMLDEMEKYPGTIYAFDCEDPNGEVGTVYLFQEDGQLYAKGNRKFSLGSRNPNDLGKIVKRDKKIKQITLVHE